MSITKLSRRSLLAGLGVGLLCAPSVVRASTSLMPISARHLPRYAYVRAFGPEAGVIEAISGQVPAWGLPADGRMVRGLQYPDLYVAVRGRTPTSDDDWVSLLEMGEEIGCASHPHHEQFPTVDVWQSMSAFGEGQLN